MALFAAAAQLFAFGNQFAAVIPFTENLPVDTVVSDTLLPAEINKRFFMEIKTFLYQDKNVHYKITGKGNPVMLVHGFGEDSTVWESQIDFLKDHFKLIIPDLPGSGRSAYIPGANIETYSEIIKDICDRELTDHPLPEKSGMHMIGHSMGGYITLSFAEKFPHYLSSFGLFHSSAFADTEEKKETRKKAIEFIKNNGAYSFLKNSIPGLFTQRFKDAQPKKVDALITAGKNFTEQALIQYYEAMIARPDRTVTLKTFGNPVLFIIGEHDQAIPFESSMKQCHLPAVSHVHVLRQSAHMGMWEEEEKTNKILLAFLQQV
jgi:pimeloyl-ACP methyl ester carboxylesterase